VLPEKQLLPLALPALGGTVLAALPLAISGFLDQPGGIPTNDLQVSALLARDYADTAQLWNVLSLVGHGLIAVTVLAAVGLMVKTFTGAGDGADQNPFGGHTIEWSAGSPAPAHNFDSVPTVASPSPLFDMTYEGSLP
jgi:heme/copper-type cytochrome/quinol oxidase subunit 1